MKKEETVMKYLDALKELKVVLKHTDRLSFLKYAVDNNLSKNFPNVMIKNKLILNKGGKANTARYHWNTIPPNVKMAERVLDECNNIGVSAMRTTRENSKNINAKSWSSDDKLFAIENRRKLKPEKIAKKLNRSKSSVVAFYYREDNKLKSKNEVIIKEIHTSKKVISILWGLIKITK